MDLQQVKKYINIKPIIEDFTDIPFTAMSKHKLAGKKKSGRPGNEVIKDIDFTEEEKKQILKGLKKVVNILEKS